MLDDSHYYEGAKALSFLMVYRKGQDDDKIWEAPVRHKASKKLLCDISFGKYCKEVLTYW